MAEYVRTVLLPLLDRWDPDDVPGTLGTVEDSDPWFPGALRDAVDDLYKLGLSLQAVAPSLSSRMVMGTNTQQRRDFLASFRAAAGIDLAKIFDGSAKVRGRTIDDGVPTTLSRAIIHNVDLIKSIPEQYMTSVRATIYGSLTGRLPGESIKKELLKIEGVTYRRARVIARDQTAKTMSAIAAARQQAIGVQSYIWRTAGDERVRENHQEKNGQVFRWDQAPPDTGHPGEDYNCRCTAEPNINEFLVALET
jgi:SPP1 gp7 family putative phage head morphogenesis protein